MIDKEALLVRVEDLVTAPLGGELAMMDVTTGKYFVLDAVAAAIWERLEAPATPAALCDQLTQAFAVSPAQCEADVLPFLESLRDKGLIRVVEK
jgi:hypothetical protein